MPPRFVELPRDLVREQEERGKREQTLTVGLIAYLPIVGVLLIAVNLLIQVHGNQGLAIAIIENLSLGSIALVVIINLIYLLTGAFIIACARVLRDRKFPGAVRRNAGFLALACLVIALLALPWSLFAIFAVLSFVVWRFPHFNLAATARTPTVSEWMGPPTPTDTVLYEIWLEGRRRLRLDGANVQDVAGVAEPASESEPRDLATLGLAINQRSSAITAATPQTVRSAIIAGILAVLPIYGLNAVIGQIKFSPLEKVTFSTGDVQVGYVFSAGGAAGIFVPKTMDNAIYLDQRPLTSRELCAFDYAAGALPTVAKQSTGAVCS